MQFDIRIPMGLMFSILGALIAGYGLFTGRAADPHTLGININLWWGLLILAFGLVMLLLAWLGRPPTRPDHPGRNETPENPV